MRVVVWVAAAVALCAADRIPKEYNVDMSTPPENRWDGELCTDNKHVMIHLIKEINFFIDIMFNEQDKALINETVAVALQSMPDPFLGELRSIAACTEYPIEQLTAANFFYDFSSTSSQDSLEPHLGCTGVIGNYNGNQVLHGRNLDFGAGPILAPSLRNSTVTINYVQNGQTLFKYTGFAGLVGAWTGYRAGYFTLEGNERPVGSFMENIQSLKAGNLPPSMIIKKVLFEATSYENAIHLFNTIPVAASVYYIIGGMNEGEGTVITVGSDKPIDQWSIKNANGWFIVQTNYDHWNQPPAHDDRRDTAIGMMNKTQPATFSPERLYTVMSTRRVLNVNTVFTVIMSAANSSLYQAVVRVPEV